jgi:selenocysteine lyase/cysteine desulfurase
MMPRSDDLPEPELDVGAAFPAVRHQTYLNSASVALVPEVAARALADWERDLTEFGTLHFDEVAEDRVYDSLRSAFGTLIDAPPGDIAVAGSATELMASLAWAVMPGAGRSIVTTDVAFPSTVYPWARVARHTGAAVRFVPSVGGIVDEDQLVDAIDAGTAAVAIGHVEYATGQRYDLSRIAEAARRFGAFLMVDASQSLGAIPLAARQEQVDAVVTTSYKWLCGPFGVGLLYLAPQWQTRLDPGIVGWRTNAEIYDLRADRCVPRDDARRFEFGTMAYGCAVSLAHSIRFLSAIGIDRVADHNRTLADRLAIGLRDGGAEVVAPSNPRARTSIVAARFPGRASADVVAELGRSGIVTSVRRGFVRFSPHLYNTVTDVDLVLDLT